MRIPFAAPLLAAILLCGSPAALPADDAATLRGQVLDPTFLEKTRVKSARDLVRIDPEMLGGALIELGEKQKNPANLPFLVAYTVQEEARHLRFVGTWAAWMSAPDAAAAAFLDRTGAEDEKEACRAVEAAGFIGAATKDRETWPKLAEVVKGARVQAAIEAARALNRTMDPRALQVIVDTACTAADRSQDHSNEKNVEHLRKHLVWAVLDFTGDEKKAARVFDGLKGRTGEFGKNAAACSEIVLDKQANPFEWKPDALKGAAAWWKSGRPKGLQPEIAIKVESTKVKINGWFAEMKKDVPGWDHYARSVLHRLAYRTDKDFEVFNMKKMTFNIESSEVIRCEVPWQGAYVLARAAGIGFCAQFGEPSRDHRGWEPAYVDLHSFMKSTKHTPPKLAEFVDEALAKKPWP